MKKPFLIIRRFTIQSIPREEYTKRRELIQKALPSNSHIIIPGYGLRYATGSIFYPFHQSTDLLYLTGFNEPNSFLVMNGTETIMFVQPYDPFTEKWDGKRIGLDGARKLYGATTAHSIQELEPYLRQLMNQKTTIYTDLPLGVKPKENLLLGTHINPASTSATHVVKETHTSHSLFKSMVKPLGVFIEQFRLLKSENERMVMRKSGQIAGRAFQKAMKATKPGMTEHELHAVLEYESKMQGATGLAYVPVVAGGNNALILHYVENQNVLKDGDLVLVDCGAEFGFYASDITRTWPVNGRFSEPQKRIYEAVLRKCVVGNTTLNELQADASHLLKNEMELVLDRRISAREFNDLYPHHVGHYIGLDVHDCPSIPRSIPFQHGMTITVEPGIYIPDDPKYGDYRGIGVRIEDDIFITRDGPIVLTAEAPKEVVDIEHLMSL